MHDFITELFKINNKYCYCHLHRIMYKRNNDKYYEHNHITKEELATRKWYDIHGLNTLLPGIHWILYAEIHGGFPLNAYMNTGETKYWFKPGTKEGEGWDCSQQQVESCIILGFGTDIDTYIVNRQGKEILVGGNSLHITPPTYESGDYHFPKGYSAQNW